MLRAIVISVFPILCFIMALSVSAQSRAESTENNALYLRCLRNGLLEFSSHPLPNHGVAKLFANDEKIDIDGLVRTKGDFRLGSDSVERDCGQSHIKIWGGYFNANMQGRMGGDDNFPIVSVTNRGTLLIDGYKMGDCVYKGEFQQDCPDKWADEIEIYPPFKNMQAKQFNGKVRVQFHKSYTMSQDFQPAPVSPQ